MNGLIDASSDAAVLHGTGNIVMEQRPVPVPAPGEVLVEVAAVGVCGSDVHYYRHGRIGTYVVDKPLVLGHEASGVVVAAGPGVDGSLVGRRVALEPGVPCRRCRVCRSGRYNLCPEIRFLGTPPVDGAFSRYLAHDADFVHPLPDALSFDAGALLEPLSVGVWASWKARIRPGDCVLVTGAGPIGLLAAQVARAGGASCVAVSDVEPYRLKLARRFGATETLDPVNFPAAAGTDGFDVLLECSGDPSAAASGIGAVRVAGRVVLVGMAPAAESLLPTQAIQNREIELTGTFRYAGTYPTAIRLAESGSVDLEGLVSGHYGLGEVEAALTAGSRDPRLLKPVVLPWTSESAR